MAQEVYNFEEHVDELHVTAHPVGVDGTTAATNANPVPVQMRTSSFIGSVTVTLDDESSADTVLDADTDCVELVMQNETGSDVWWLPVGNTDATAYVILHSGDVAVVPVDNLNKIQARMDTGAGAGSIVVVWRT